MVYEILLIIKYAERAGKNITQTVLISKKKKKNTSLGWELEQEFTTSLFLFDFSFPIFWGRS